MGKIIRGISVFTLAVYIFLLSGQFPIIFSEEVFPELQPDDSYIVLEEDFENGTGGWAPLGGQADLSIDPRISKKGSVSLNVSNRANTWSGPYLQTTSLFQPGETYKFKAYIHHDGDSIEKINFILQYENASGTQYLPIQRLEIGSTQWGVVDTKITMPSDMTSSGIYFEALNLDLSFNIDNIMITCSKQTAQVTQNKYGELEYTFSFEEGFETWTPRGDAMIETSSNFSFLGRYSLYVSERTKVWNAAQTDISALIEPGVTYRYSAYVMYNGKTFENEHDYILSLQYTLNGKVEYPVLCEKKLQKGNWSKLEGDFEIPEGASQISLFVSTKYPADEEEITQDDLMAYYIDNVVIEDSTMINKEKNKNLLKRACTLIGIFAAIAGVIAFVCHRTFIRSFAVADASRDSMTDVLNRNSYEIQILHYENCPNECRKLYFTICDLNYLKHINDNYGHQKGDDAITRCASVLRHAVEKKGGVYRTGGDEFVCITRSNLDEKIKQSLNIEAQNYKGYPFSVAVGTSSYQSEEDGPVPDIKQILARSDKEMYKNKEDLKKEMHI